MQNPRSAPNSVHADKVGPASLHWHVQFAGQSIGAAIVVTAEQDRGRRVAGSSKHRQQGVVGTSIGIDKQSAGPFGDKRDPARWAARHSAKYLALAGIAD